MNEGINDGLNFPWGHNRRFNDLSGYIKNRFGSRIQKLSIDAGFTCPNRDGTKGTGGCTFCNNKSFNPSYCSSDLSVAEQLGLGMKFFSRKYPGIGYLAYFQAYTNTYASLDHLIKLYEESVSIPGVRGIVIGTRPDCISDPLLDYLGMLSRRCFVSVEYGVESTLDRTLLRINRGHDYNSCVTAVKDTAKRGIHVGAHLILGLPGESSEDLLNHARRLNELPLNMVKLHQLQIIKGTLMENEYIKFPGDFLTFTAEEYVDLVIRFLEILNPDFIIERFAGASPQDMISGKRWGLKNFELVAKVEDEMANRNTWQGRLFQA